jgi:hypothetical protein
MKPNLNKTIGLLEQALRDIGPDENQAREVRLHILRALNEARYLMKRQAINAAKKDQLNVWNQWKLDLERNVVVDPRHQKLAVNLIDGMIDAEQQKLSGITDKKDSGVDQKDSQTLLG